MPLRRTVDGAAFGDLTLEAGEELAAGGAVFVEAEGGGGVGLGGVEEGVELDEVDAVLAVIVVMVAGGPADAAVGRGGGVRRRCGRKGGSQGSPVRALQMRRSRPRSDRSVLMSLTECHCRSGRAAEGNRLDVGTRWRHSEREGPSCPGCEILHPGPASGRVVE